MKLYNSLTKKIEDFKPTSDTIGIYSCGPTVYNNLHIGNLSAFIYADLLRRALVANFPDHTVHHVMNITDVDDKTIRDSKGLDVDPMVALKTLTKKYDDVFRNDMRAIGNDIEAIDFINATDSIEDMLNIIHALYDQGFAYIADDGVYFSISAYQDSGKKYGQLVHIDESSTSASRIQNDEYDKESAHDFALWKVTKAGEPSWPFELNGKTLDGRPGWHIECSAMSKKLLGQPFDIHTGGIDLKFPHHENEIAQSTATTSDPTMARFFVHNEHVLVDGKKMSKSLGNVKLLSDIVGQSYENTTFSAQDYRILVLSSNYRKETEFTTGNLYNANRLGRTFLLLRDILDQVKPSSLPPDIPRVKINDLQKFRIAIIEHLSNDLNGHLALMELSGIVGYLINHYLTEDTVEKYLDYVIDIENLLGLTFDNRVDKKIVTKIQEFEELNREARKAGSAEAYKKSDYVRDELKNPENEDPIYVTYNPAYDLYSWHRATYSNARTQM